MLAAVVVALAVPAEARPSWPRPAAGESHSGDPEVIFTFDDGPHERYSAMILDTLARHGVSAIFYWVGHRIDDHRRDSKKRRRRRVLIQRAINDGHLIGNHTVNHVHLCHQTVDAAAEIDQNDSLYQRLAEFPIVLFRAPYGDRCHRLEVLLGERGFTHLHWDIDPREYNGLTAEGTAEYVIGKLKGLRGRAVVLMHDTKGASAHALPRILDWIDIENQRRQTIGRRPIRILSGSDLLIQSQHGPLWSWGEETASSARGLLSRAVGSLVPGAPVSPVVADDAVPGAPGGPATSAGLEGGQRADAPASAGIAGQRPDAPAVAGVDGQRADAPASAGAVGQQPAAPATAGVAGGPRPDAPASAGMAGGPRPYAPSSAGIAAGQRPGAPASTGITAGPQPGAPAPTGTTGPQPGAPASTGSAGPQPGGLATAGTAGGQRPGAPATAGSAGGQRRGAPATAGTAGGKRPGAPAVAGAPAHTHTSTLASP